MIRWTAAALAGALCLYLTAGSVVIAMAASRLLQPEVLLEAFDMPERPTDPLTLGYRGDPLEAFGFAFETVTIATPLGPAPAWWVPAAQQDGTMAAVYVHGVAGAREDGYRHLSMLHERGIPALLISYRNDTDAPAAPHGRYAMGVEEWPDLEAAIDFLAGEGFTSIILVGESMGGAISAHFLRHSPRASHVVALALDSPALQFDPVLQTVGEAIGLPFSGLLARPARWFLSATGPTRFSGTDLTDVAARFDGPLFLAHGTTDSAVPFRISQAVYALRAGPLVFVETHADHLQSYAEDPARYREAFFDFLDGIE